MEGGNFPATEVSYIGNPRSHTAVFVTGKVESLITNLSKVTDCLVFAEEGISVDAELKNKHTFIFSSCPQREYAVYVTALYDRKLAKERKRQYRCTAEGYYIGENVKIGSDAYIEPGCVIGHDVVIGDNACILAGAVIKNCIIGNGFLANENAVIGAAGFTITEDESGNKFRIPTLGRVIIGNYVEVGAHDNISSGSGGDTIIEDYVKLDALVYIGHDAHLYKNVEVTAGSIVGGFDQIASNVYVGLNSTIRNRITLEDECFIGMGSIVTKSVKRGVTVAGNPARPFYKKEK